MSKVGARLLALATWNAALAVLAIAALAPDLPAPARMAAAGLLVLVLPGAACLGAFRRALDPPRLALAVVGLSSVVMGLGLLASALGGDDPSRLRLLAVVAAMGSGALLLFGPPRRPSSGVPWLLIAGVGSAGFALASTAALHLVPPLAWPEMEVRGTAWGLAATGRPWFAGEHDTPLSLANPVLVHAMVAESLLVSGEIGLTERAYTSARATALARSADIPIDSGELRREDHAAFVADPAVLGTRAVPVLLFAATLALLFELARRLTGSRTAGAAAAALFALSPGTLVDASSAGYLAPATFALVTTALLTEAPLGRRPELGWIAAGAALGSLLDQGTVVLVLGAGGIAVLRALVAAARAPAARGRALREALDPRAVALAAGFVCGTALWCGYGLWVDAGTFARTVRAFTLAGGTSLAEFSARTGHGLLPPALAALAVWAAAPGSAEPRRTLAGWGLLAAAAGTLAAALPALAAAAVTLAWTALPRRVRTGGEPLRAVPRAIAWTAVGLLVVSLAFEVAGTVRLVRDLRP